MTAILALCLAAPAEAANAGKHKKPVTGATAHAMKHRRTTAVVQPAFRYQGGVPAGPLIARAVREYGCTYVAKPIELRSFLRLLESFTHEDRPTGKFSSR